MANALAILILETELPIAMTCADATGIEKGQCLKISDPFTVAATAAANDAFGGIAAEEKIANDGKTKIAVYRKGIFLLEAGTTGVTVGVPMKIEANNEFTDVVGGDAELARVWGTSLETAVNGEFYLAEVGK
jgi:hypothetical protein